MMVSGDCAHTPLEVMKFIHVRGQYKTEDADDLTKNDDEKIEWYGKVSRVVVFVHLTRKLLKFHEKYYSDFAKTSRTFTSTHQLLSYLLK